jgi:hypothetical protein
VPGRTLQTAKAGPTEDFAPRDLSLRKELLTRDQVGGSSYPEYVGSTPNLRNIQPGNCWWCGDPADSREHKLKRSDLVREFGPPPYYGARTLQRVSGAGSQSVTGPGSAVFKFDPSLCARCNDTRSQPFDRAWDAFTNFLAKNEKMILATQHVDLRSVFGGTWLTQAADIARYLVKHLICRIVHELPGPIKLDAPLFEFLDGGAFPECLQIDARLDLGVIAMLELTRSAPTEDPQAAMAGFLHLGSVWVELDGRRHWHTPQGGLHYRWSAFYWRIGAGGAQNPFADPVMALTPTDELFGPDVRELFEVQRQVPAEVLLNVPDGSTMPETVRAAGYAEVADRLEALISRVNAKREVDEHGAGD